MKVNKATGLVPVKFAAPWGNYQTGETGGVAPADAVLIAASKFGEIVPHPEGVETEDWNDDRIAEGVSTVTPMTDIERDNKRKDGIEIPAGWAKLHHLQRIRLAAEIAGTSIPSPELADATINDELVRRGKAVTLFRRGEATRGDIENIATDVNIPAQPGYTAVAGGTPKEPDDKKSSKSKAAA